jgi:antibiotic biosynthesis monooxygenase (ABM) superfamily enzyme
MRFALFKTMLQIGVPRLVRPALAAIGVPPNVLLYTLAVTAVIVYLMVYVIMPRYTRLVRGWLYR